MYDRDGRDLGWTVDEYLDDLALHVLDPRRPLWTTDGTDAPPHRGGRRTGPHHLAAQAKEERLDHDARSGRCPNCLAIDKANESAERKAEDERAQQESFFKGVGLAEEPALYYARMGNA